MTTAHFHSTKPGHGLSTSSNPIQAQELYMKAGRVLENDLENQKKAEYFSVIFLSKTWVNRSGHQNPVFYEFQEVRLFRTTLNG